MCFEIGTLNPSDVEKDIMVLEGKGYDNSENTEDTVKRIQINMWRKRRIKQCSFWCDEKRRKWKKTINIIGPSIVELERSMRGEIFAIIVVLGIIQENTEGFIPSVVQKKMIYIYIYRFVFEKAVDDGDPF